VTPDETKRTGLVAIECFNDPTRRDEYFETLYADDVALHGYTSEPLTLKATVKGFYQVLFDAFPCHVDTEAMYVQRDVLTWRFRFSGNPHRHVPRHPAERSVLLDPRHHYPALRREPVRGAVVGGRLPCHFDKCPRECRCRLTIPNIPGPPDRRVRSPRPVAK
jgi:hypothetical protein